MIVVNRIDESLIGSIEGSRFGLPYDEVLYSILNDLKLESEDCKTIEEYQAIIAKAHFALEHHTISTTTNTTCQDVIFNKETGKYHYLFNNGSISEWEIPVEFVNRIFKSIEQGISPLPLLKFWLRAIRPVPGKVLNQNKLNNLIRYIEYKSVDIQFRNSLIKDKGITIAVASERALFYQVPITQEGLLCTYKVSTELLDKYDAATGEKTNRYNPVYDEDTGKIVHNGFPDHVEERVFYPAVQGLTGGEDFWCEDTFGNKKLGHLIKVGCVHYLDSFDQVDQYDDTFCVKGLHVGNLDFIKGYQHKGTVTHDVFVDPMDIGAITNDGSGALRVVRYFVHKSNAGQNRGIYHSSRYAQMGDDRWAEFKQQILDEAIKANQVLNDKFLALGSVILEL